MLPAATVVSLLAMVGWLYLLAGHGRYWRTDQRLPRGTDRWVPGGDGSPGVPRPWPAVGQYHARNWPQEHPAAAHGVPRW